MADHTKTWMMFDDLKLNCPTEQQLRELVSGMPFRSALRRIAVSGGCVLAQGIRGQKDRQALALGQIKLSQEIILKIDKYFLQNGFPWVLHRRGLLELLKWVAHYASDNEAEEEPDNFLFSQIAAAELSTQRHDTLLNGNPADDNLTRIKKCLPVIREWALMGLPAWFPLHSLGRAKLILLDRVFQDPAIVESFQQNTNGLSLPEFYSCVAGIALLGLGDKSNGGIRLTFSIDNLCAGAPDFRPIFEKFFEHFSISAADLRTELRKRPVDEFYDYKLFRSRPILRLEGHEFIILDQVFFQDMMAYGPLFKTLNLGVHKVFGAFGQAFESYCQTIMDEFHARMSARLIESGRISKNRKLNIAANNQPELCDISLTYDRDLVLIETKGAWLKDDSLKAMNYEVFWGELMDKYGVPANPEERDKGIAQLANSIKRIANGINVTGTNADESPIIPASLQIVFPILLVHDSLLTAQGFASTALAAEFATLLGQQDAPQQGYFTVSGEGPAARQLRVMNLILMSVADLENFAAARVNNKSFLSHLREYSNADPLRMRLTFDLYIKKTFHIFEADWYPPVIPARQLLQEAGNRLLPPDEQVVLDTSQQ